MSGRLGNPPVFLPPLSHFWRLGVKNLLCFHHRMLDPTWKIRFSYQKSMIFLAVALVDSKMLTNNIVLQKCTFHRLTGKPDVYVQNRIPSICALTTCQKMLRSYSTLSGLALMTQDSSREGRGLHRDSLKSSHMARAWSQILQLVCD